jgi:multidrug efflux pump
MERRFWLTDWSVRNRTTVYVLAVLVLSMGLYTYVQLPKELFPMLWSRPCW